MDSIKDYLKSKYYCHAIILYGSFADGTYTNESDIDIVCFSDRVDDRKNDTSVIDTRQLDAWIYPTKMMEQQEALLHINGGKIILDERKLCCKLLEDIDKIFNDGVKKLSIEQIDFQKSWLKKMVNRARKGDVEGNFRYHWLLVDSLEIYFEIRGLWYMGPKKSLIWLKENEQYTYKLFEDALATHAPIEKIEELIEFITNIET